MELCDEETKKVIAEYQDMSGKELEELASEILLKIGALEKDASEKIMELENRIIAVIDGYTKESEQLKVDSSYKYIAAVLKTKGNPEDNEYDDGDDGKEEL